MPETTFSTRSQAFAQRAFGRVESIQGTGLAKEYRSFATSFPSLIHACGLAQALAFAQAKSARRGEEAAGGNSRAAAVRKYLGHLADTLTKENGEALASDSRKEQALTLYLRLSRDALAASIWLKRYAEALLNGKEHV